MNKNIPESFDKAVKDIEEGKTVPLDTALNEEPPTESETFDKEEKVPESFWEALFGFRDQDVEEARELFQTAMDLAKKYKDERDEYKIGYDRYEKLRRLSPKEFHDLYDKNLTSGTPFDTLVDKL